MKKQVVIYVEMERLFTTCRILWIHSTSGLHLLYLQCPYPSKNGGINRVFFQGNTGSSTELSLNLTSEKVGKEGKAFPI